MISDTPSILWSQTDLKDYLQSATEILDTDFCVFATFVRELYCFLQNHDLIFALQTQMRERREIYQQEIEEWQEKQQAWEHDHGDFLERIQAVKKQIFRAEAGIQGIEKALSRVSPKKHEALQAKQEELRLAHRFSQEQLEARYEDPRWQGYQSLLAEKEQFYRTTGLSPVQKRIHHFQKKQGQDAQKTGSDFEHQMTGLTQKYLIHHCLRLSPQALIPQTVHILRNVRLRSTKLEFDAMVVQVLDFQEPVIVLAIIEAKKNPNDLGTGFLRRQENISWCTQSPDGYVRSEYKNKHYPSGLFDTEVGHFDPVSKRSYRFSHRSFSLFQRHKTGYFLERLYFVCSAQPLIGISSKEHAILKHKLTMEFEKELEESAIRALWEDMRSHRKQGRTAVQVLELYTAEAWLSQHLMMVLETP